MQIGVISNIHNKIMTGTAYFLPV